MKTNECTIAELASLLGLTVQRITRLQAEGVIKRIGRNRYNTAQAVQAYIRYRETTVRTELGDDGSLTSARVEWTETKARLAQLELQTRSGKLLSRDDVTNAWAAIVTTLRMRLLSVPAQRLACSQRRRSRSISSPRPTSGVVEARSASKRLSAALAPSTCDASTFSVKPLSAGVPRSR
jgi:phage terminase Nu1 subunit (DNA packaging protein)